MELSTLLLTLSFIFALLTLFLRFPTQKLKSFFNPTSSAKRVAPESPNKPKTNEDELKRVFSSFDKDGDGFITKDELRQSMKVPMTEAEVEDTVARLDKNGDGLIELAEFCEVFGGDLGMREAFDVYDYDGDGMISAEEIGRVMGSLGMGVGRKVEDWREMVRMADLDGDGMVSFDEFKKMMMTSYVVSG